VLILRERLKASDSATENEGMNIVGPCHNMSREPLEKSKQELTFIGVDSFEVHDVANDVVLVRDAVTYCRASSQCDDMESMRTRTAEHVTSNASNVQGFAT